MANPLTPVNKFFKGNVTIPFTNQHMPKVVVYPAIAGGLLLGGYLLVQNGLITLPPELQQLFGGGGGPNATTAIIEAPVAIKPDRVFPVRGTFVNEAGTPRPVENAFWYITDQTGAVRSNGMIGQNISSFSFDIPLTGLEIEKDYTIYVADAPAGSPEANLVVRV